MLTRQKHRSPKIIFRRIAALSLILFCCFWSVPSLTGQTAKTTETNFRLPFKLCWKFSSEYIESRFIASDNVGSFYIFNTDGKITSINEETGSVNWQLEIGGQIVSKYSLSDQRIYFVLKKKDEDDKDKDKDEKKHFTVCSLDKVTGITLWQSEQTFKVEPEEFFLDAADKVLLLLTDKGDILSMAAADGRTNQSVSVGSPLSSTPVFDSGRITITTITGQIMTYLRIESSLSKIIDLKVSAVPTSLVTDRLGNFLWGDSRGFVNLTDRRGKTERKFRGGGKIEKIVKTTAGFLVVSLDNYLYLLSEKKSGGDLVWKKRLAERLFYAPEVAGDYAFVFVAAEQVGVLVIELKSGKTINKLIVEADDSLSGSPVVIGNLVVLPTLRGLFAYSSVACSSQS